PLETIPVEAAFTEAVVIQGRSVDQIVVGLEVERVVHPAAVRDLLSGSGDNLHRLAVRPDQQAIAANVAPRTCLGVGPAVSAARALPHQPARGGGVASKNSNTRSHGRSSSVENVTVGFRQGRRFSTLAPLAGSLRIVARKATPDD